MTDFALTIGLISWWFYNEFFTIIKDYGIVYLPLLVFIWQNWLGNLNRDPNSSSVKLTVNRMLTSLIMFVILYAVAFLPLIPLSNVYAYKSSGVNESAYTVINDNATEVQKDLNISSASLKIPLVWAMLDAFTTLVSNSFIDIIPTEIGDIRQEMATVVNNSNITDESLRQRYNNFYNQCYSSALGKFQHMAKEGQIDTESFFGSVDDSEYDWVGGSYFVNTEGFYKPCEKGAACYKDDVPTPGGFYAIINNEAISCLAFWEGLSVDLKAHFNIAPLNTDIPSAGITNITADDRILKIYLEKNAYEDSSDLSFDVLFSLDSWVQLIKNIFVWLGGVIVLLLTEVVTTAVVAFLPLGQAIVLAVFVILLPIALIVSALRPDLVIGFLMFYFAVSFLTVVWAIVGFLDNFLMYLVYNTGDSSILQVVASVVSSFTITGLMMSIATLFLYYQATTKWFQMMRMAGGSGMEEAKDAISSTRETADKTGSQAKSTSQSAGTTATNRTNKK